MFALNFRQRLAVALVIFALQFISCCLAYDSRAGLAFSNYPYFWKVSEVGKHEAVSMIDSRQIETYGVRRGQILLGHKDGRWFSLSYFNNQEIVRKLGGQGAHYVCYSTWF